MGWSNEIPNPLVVGGGISGEIDVVDANNNVIMRVNSVGLLVFDTTSGKVIASMAPTFAVVGSQTIVTGIGSYNVAAQTAAQITGDNINFNIAGNALNVSGEITVTNPAGATNQSAILYVFSPTTNGDSNQTLLSLIGKSADGSLQAQIQLGQTSVLPVQVLVQGELVYSVPSGLNNGTPEAFHVPTLNANWGNVAGRAPLQYKRTPDGKVTFAGAVQWNSGATAPPITLFTLPAAYRPDHIKELVTRTMPGSTVTPVIQGLQVLTDGTVQVTDGPAATFPQSPISFDDVAFYLAVSS